MTSLQDVDEFAEQYRAKLHQGLAFLVSAMHEQGDCPNPAEQCLENEYEHALKQVDRVAVTTGQAWHVALAGIVKLVELRVQRLKEDT